MLAHALACMVPFVQFGSIQDYPVRWTGAIISQAAAEASHSQSEVACQSLGLRRSAMVGFTLGAPLYYYAVTSGHHWRPGPILKVRVT